MRVPGPQIGFQPSGKGGVGHLFVQLEKMRVTATDSDPNHFRSTS